MTIPSSVAAKFICKKSGWEVTNLELQKILYIAHMFHIGKNKEPLIQEHFEAWDYGPVVPELYKKVRMFGASAIKDVFFGEDDLDEKNSVWSTLDSACESLLDKSPGYLVSATHWSEGAWAKVYIPNVRGIKIPNEDIIEEYKKRKRLLYKK